MASDPLPNVLFGYDGTENNDLALQWAVEEAALRGLDLLLAHSAYWPYPDGQADPTIGNVLERVGRNILAQGARRARELGATGGIHKRLMSGPVAEGLLHESDTAEVIVVGSHERHYVPVGSTALQLPARTHRPVFVVRRAAAVPKIVVGVDGSAGGAAALGFAFEEARLRDWSLRILYACWEPGVAAEPDLELFTDRPRLERVKRDFLERLVAPWYDRFPAVDVEAALSLDRPREALLEATEEAGLLVVGDRGVGGLDPLLLGATSSVMLHHARCTVAVVPRDARPEPPGTRRGSGS
ncbi:universal stress protein [Actinomadura roseirufa]|uniref:universal stress protein n=1 Tax=Actinomadura roseirufa TaxID=2094049 RepID=UPI001040FE42|nr:universal stress protein [Actinomadura roseirufa]